MTLKEMKAYVNYLLDTEIPRNVSEMVDAEKPKVYVLEFKELGYSEIVIQFKEPALKKFYENGISEQQVALYIGAGILFPELIKRAGEAEVERIYHSYNKTNFYKSLIQYGAAGPIKKDWSIMAIYSTPYYKKTKKE